MIVRTIGLAAVGLALAADAIMIPSTVALPGLTTESLDRQHEPSEDTEDAVQALPMPSDLIEKLKDLHLGVSKPFPFLTQDDEEAKPAQDDEDSDDEDSDDEDSDDEEDNVHGPTHIHPTLDGPFYEDVDYPEDLTVIVEDVEHDSDDFGAWIKGSDVLPVGQWIELDDNDDNGSDCPTGSSPDAIFCRIRAMVASKFDQVKPYFTEHRRPCPKKHGQMAGSLPGKPPTSQRPPISGGPAKFWQSFKDEADGFVFFDDEADGNVGQYASHHHNHHHHAHGSKFMRILHSVCSGIRTFVTSFLIPILIGVAAGMTASLVGMCVGTVLAWLWIKFVRGGKRGNARAIVLEEAEIENGEKEGLLEVEVEAVEAPPVYVEKTEQ